MINAPRFTLISLIWSPTTWLNLSYRAMKGLRRVKKSEHCYHHGRSVNGSLGWTKWTTSVTSRGMVTISAASRGGQGVSKDMADGTVSKARRVIKKKLPEVPLEHEAGAESQPSVPLATSSESEHKVKRKAKVERLDPEAISPGDILPASSTRTVKRKSKSNPDPQTQIISKRSEATAPSSQTASSGAAAMTASDPIILTQGLPPTDGSWGQPRFWVVFSDLHVTPKTLDTCLEVRLGGDRC